MAEIMITDADTSPEFFMSINGVDHSGLVGVVFTPDADVLEVLQQSHYADNIVLADLRNLTVPTITGTAQDGQTLTGHHGTYNNPPIDCTYRWLADDVEIEDETAITLVLAAGQIGAVITFEETARDLTGTAVGDVSRDRGGYCRLMPRILEDRVAAIRRSNPRMPESSAWAIATSALKREGKLKIGKTRRNRKLP